MISFFVMGLPIPKQSYRHTKHGGYTPPHVKAWQETVAVAARQEMAGQPPLTGQLYTYIDFYLPNFARKDLGNLEKSVCDAMNGIVYQDDSQIYSMILTKYIDANAGVDIHVGYQTYCCAGCSDDVRLDMGHCTNKDCMYYKYEKRVKARAEKVAAVTTR